MILGFEMKYNNMIRGRMDKIEAFVDHLAMEQAKLNAKGPVANYEPSMTVGDSKYEENGLFPTSMYGSVGQNEKTSIFDSTTKDRQVENIKDVLVDIKNEQAFT